MQSIPTLDQEPVATKAKEGIRDKLPKVTNPETQRAASQNGEWYRRCGAFYLRQRSAGPAFVG